MLKLIDDENKEIKFEDKEKRFPIVNFLLEFLAWINLSKKTPKNKKKSREQHIEDILVELEKELAHFQVTVQKKEETTYKNSVDF